MAISAQSSAKRVYPQHPKGSAHLVLIGIVDRGLQENIFDTSKPDVPKLSFHFESATTDAETDTRYNVSKWVTNSDWYDSKTGKQSGLVAMLCEWLDCTASEIPAAVFEDLEVLCGLNARARIVQKPNQSTGEMKASIASFEPWEGEIIEPEEAVGEVGIMFRGKTFEQLKEELNWGDSPPVAAPRRKIAAKVEAPSRAATAPDSDAITQPLDPAAAARRHAKDLAAGRETAPMARPARPPVPEGAHDDDDIGNVFDDEDDTPMTLIDVPKQSGYGQH